ncbi:hypothetical protein B0T26DRAFT_669901 [Lasiosphaeria miniovina]|uniref:Secreted protein n=1 Tax=Lasiosphaeria miniovina TaxID=1954250 RepID=A0AA40BFZ5_9PEZI|nr:uncharacterized protein B0T26DRAFT_669901 [Lasiosphaeria miniovina]KAK0733496.1 hypothetical protein B0T26DRAFT_669901 [Lasiosphaeria miniovina]
MAGGRVGRAVHTWLPHLLLAVSLLPSQQHASQLARKLPPMEVSILGPCCWIRWLAPRLYGHCPPRTKPSRSFLQTHQFVYPASMSLDRHWSRASDAELDSSFVRVTAGQRLGVRRCSDLTVLRILRNPHPKRKQAYPGQTNAGSAQLRLQLLHQAGPYQFLTRARPRLATRSGRSSV